MLLLDEGQELKNSLLCYQEYLLGKREGTWKKMIWRICKAQTTSILG